MGTAWQKLIVQQDTLTTLLRLAQEGAPEEICGLLAGTAGRVFHVLPVMNELHSPIRFRMEPREQLARFLWMDQNDLDLLAIYHSHPRGPVEPSPTDISEFSYPGTISMIISLERNDVPALLPETGGLVGGVVRGFEIQDGAFSPVEIAVE